MMHVLIFDKIPKKISFKKNEILFGPFMNVEDTDYFLQSLNYSSTKKETHFTEEEPKESYWLLITKNDS